MCGGLMQLIGYGAYDIYLCSNIYNGLEKKSERIVLPNILYKNFIIYEYINKFILESETTNKKYIIDNLQDKMTLNFDDPEVLYDIDHQINYEVKHKTVICYIESKNNNIIINACEYKAKTINISLISVIPDDTILYERYKNINNELYYWNNKIYAINDLIYCSLSINDKISKVTTEPDEIIFKLKDKQYIVRKPIFTPTNISIIFSKISIDKLINIINNNHNLEKIISGEIINNIIEYDYKLINLIKEQDKKICELALKKNPRAIYYIKKNTNELALLAYKYNIKSLQYIKERESLNDNTLDIIFQNENTIKYFPVNKNIEIKALTINGLSLQYIKRQNETKCLIAVRQNGLALQYVKHQTKNICDNAIKQNKEATIYIKSKKQKPINQMVKYNYEDIDCIHLLFEHNFNY